MMNPVYLSYYKRTAFSRAHPKKSEVDQLAEHSGPELLNHLINHFLDTTQLDPHLIDELSIGCALAVKEQWSFGGRYPVLQTHLGDQCASRMLDQQCGSGLAALRLASLGVASGNADIALAAGYEQMTRVPMGPKLFQEGVLTLPKMLESYDATRVMNMGLTAESLAKKGSITRESMDQFAFLSHQRAAGARDQGFLAEEILPIELSNGAHFSTDASIRETTTADALAGLSPVFDPEGMVTAGNSSPLTSGAALIALSSEAALDKFDANPVAKVLGCIDRGTQPELMGQGVVPAVEKLLKLHNLTADQIDFWEINEAFSVVPLYAIASLKIDPERVNVHGGALAIGHPLGATGIRLAGTLARTLHIKQGKLGVAAACIGGGQGIALLLEAV